MFFFPADKDNYMTNAIQEDKIVPGNVIFRFSLYRFGLLIVRRNCMYARKRVFFPAVQLASMSQHSPLEADKCGSSLIGAEVVTIITMMFILYVLNFNFCKISV